MSFSWLHLMASDSTFPALAALLSLPQCHKSMAGGPDGIVLGSIFNVVEPLVSVHQDQVRWYIVTLPISKNSVSLSSPLHTTTVVSWPDVTVEAHYPPSKSKKSNAALRRCSRDASILRASRPHYALAGMNRLQHTTAILPPHLVANSSSFSLSRSSTCFNLACNSATLMISPDMTGHDMTGDRSVFRSFTCLFTFTYV